MNLGQIRADVETELQYAPELLAWRKDVRNVVNRVYKSLARERKWPWLFRQKPLYGFPDLLVPEGATGIAFSAGAGPRHFTILRSKLRDLLGFNATSAQLLTEELQQHLTGAELDVASGNRYLGQGNWEKAPFVIERNLIVDPASGTAQLEFWLDPRANITATDGTIGTFSLRFPRIRLPADCDQLLALSDDQGNPLTALTPDQARAYLRSTTITAQYPSFLLEDGGFQPSGPDHLVPVNNFGGVRFDAHQALFARENWSFRNPFAVVASVAVGTMAIGTTTRVFLSWYYGGRFGPPSATVEFVTTAQRGIRLTGLPLLPNTTGSTEYGRQIAVFMAEDEGAFFLRGIIDDPTTTTFELLTSNTDVATMGEGLRFARWDEVYPNGPYQYIRLMPRPSKLTRFSLDYYGRPRELIEDTDAPEFEEAYHPLLVWLAAIEICTRFGQGKVLPMWAAEAARLRAGLDTRYFPQKRYEGGQKGMIGQTEIVRPTQTVDWHGDS